MYPDLDQLRLPPSANGDRIKIRPPRHQGNEWFLRGPVPGRWLAKAARLPGKTFQVAILLWHSAGLTSRAEVRVTSDLRQNFGIDRKTTYRALERLEDVGLISVDRTRGRCPVVTIQSCVEP